MSRWSLLACFPSCESAFHFSTATYSMVLYRDIVLPHSRVPERASTFAASAHWIGVACIRGARVEDVIETLREYDRYVELYPPTVVDVNVIERSVNAEHASDHFALTFVNESFFSKRALECESTSSYARLDASRWYSQSHTVRVQECVQYGTAHQPKLPAGQGAGYIWSASTIGRFEERDGGVYVEMEAIALSRGVPVAMREFANPIMRRVSKSTLVTSLDGTRKAVERKTESATIRYKAGE
jgi:hypothetical protein